MMTERDRAHQSEHAGRGAATRTTPPPQDERTLGELFRDLSREVGVLIRQEVALAKAEFAEKVRQLLRGSAMAVAGGLALYAGFLALVSAAILGLSMVIAPWLAALIVSAVVLVVGVVVLQAGISKLKDLTPLPQRTMKSIEDDKEMVEERLR